MNHGRCDRPTHTFHYRTSGDGGGFLASWRNSDEDFRRILFNPNSYPALAHILKKYLTTQTLDVSGPPASLVKIDEPFVQVRRGAGLIAALSNDSNRRAAFVESQVKSKFERMLHPPLTYLGDAFQYRTVDGKFNSAMSPHLGQAGAPYAKTVRDPGPVLYTRYLWVV